MRRLLPHAAAVAALGLAALPAWTQESGYLKNPPPLASVAPPLDSKVHLSRPNGPPQDLPYADTPFFEHVRVLPTAEETAPLKAPTVASGLKGVEAEATTPVVMQGGTAWVGTADGLYGSASGASGTFERHGTYGVAGPLSNVIAGIAVDSKGTLWVATPAGLSARSSDGEWRLIRGPQGLPWEELTAIAIDESDGIWLGSTWGLIHHRPYAEGRQWYYRAGERYLPGDQVERVHVANGGKTVYALTDKGWGRIDEVSRTLHEKAELIQARYLDRHRRLGMPSPALHNDAYTMETWTHGTQPSDGLWTSYHVTAMCMAYTLTGEERYKESATEGMEALYLLQNITEIPGLVARTMALVDEPAGKHHRGAHDWRETSGGKYIWRDDVSSDQIDGHYFAFYSYYEHIAKHDPAAKARIEKQIRQVTDYIVDNGFRIIDWDGEMTLWGWWDPERLNEKPVHYLESALYSMLMLSHLKLAHHITGDEKYDELYRMLIEEHGYLSNMLLTKKLYPDELNHSDDQMSAIGYYPFIQLEHDPFIRGVLQRTIRRHALIERDEHNSLIAFVYASMDPQDADIEGGLQTLREMPVDRRNWRMENSHRADIVLQPGESRQDMKVTRDLLPADERDFERWNMDPYRADTGGDGRTENSGEHYLLAYWMARYHGLLAAPAP